CQQDYTTLWTF
nr:immunoglobulin light chain junction region [Macaca mulatta]